MLPELGDDEPLRRQRPAPPGAPVANSNRLALRCSRKRVLPNLPRRTQFPSPGSDRASSIAFHAADGIVPPFRAKHMGPASRSGLWQTSAQRLDALAGSRFEQLIRQQEQPGKSGTATGTTATLSDHRPKRTIMQLKTLTGIAMGLAPFGQATLRFQRSVQ
jgi:hypothetical protein